MRRASGAVKVVRTDLLPVPPPASTTPSVPPTAAPQPAGTAALLSPSSPGSCLDDFVILQELGRGAHGIVNKVRSKLDDRVYVLKSVVIGHLDDRHRKRAMSEVSVLRRLHHPNVVAYHTCFVAKETLYIVMEYAGGGDLHSLTKQLRSQRRYIPERRLWSYCWQLCQGVKHLHSRRIIHRDLKSLNVFLSSRNRIKIGDMGVSRIVESDAMLRTRIGTPLYLAPELVKAQPYSFKVDVWALGCIMYQLAALRTPFRGENLVTLAREITQKRPKPLPRTYTKAFNTVITRMLEKSSSKRPDIDGVLALFPSTLRRAFMVEDRTYMARFQQAEGVRTAAAATDRRSQQHDQMLRRQVPSDNPSTVPVTGFTAASAAQPPSPSAGSPSSVPAPSAPLKVAPVLPPSSLSRFEGAQAELAVAPTAPCVGGFLGLRDRARSVAASTRKPPPPGPPPAGQPDSTASRSSGSLPGADGLTGGSGTEAGGGGGGGVRTAPSIQPAPLPLPPPSSSPHNHPASLPSPSVSPLSSLEESTRAGSPVPALRRPPPSRRPQSAMARSTQPRTTGLAVSAATNPKPLSSGDSEGALPTSISPLATATAPTRSSVGPGPTDPTTVPTETAAVAATVAVASSRPVAPRVRRRPQSAHQRNRRQSSSSRVGASALASLLNSTQTTRAAAPAPPTITTTPLEVACGDDIDGGVGTTDSGGGGTGTGIGTGTGGSGTAVGSGRIPNFTPIHTQASTTPVVVANVSSLLSSLSLASIPSSVFASVDHVTALARRQAATADGALKPNPVAPTSMLVAEPRELGGLDIGSPEADLAWGSNSRGVTEPVLTREPVPVPVPEPSSVPVPAPAPPPKPFRRPQSAPSRRPGVSSINALAGGRLPAQPNGLVSAAPTPAPAPAPAPGSAFAYDFHSALADQQPLVRATAPSRAVRPSVPSVHVAATVRPDQHPSNNSHTYTHSNNNPAGAGGRRVPGVVVSATAGGPRRTRRHYRTSTGGGGGGSGLSGSGGGGRSGGSSRHSHRREQHRHHHSHHRRGATATRRAQSMSGGKDLSRVKDEPKAVVLKQFARHGWVE